MYGICILNSEGMLQKIKHVNKENQRNPAQVKITWSEETLETKVRLVQPKLEVGFLRLRPGPMHEINSKDLVLSGTWGNYFGHDDEEIFFQNQKDLHIFRG